MNFDEINQILDMMREHDLVEFELDRDDVKVRLKKQASGQVAVMPAAPVVAVPAAAPVASAPAAAAPVPAAAADENEFAVVKSPIVGTAYLSAEPGAAPFARVGSQVKAGETVLIVEAMKVMNAITAPVAGTVKAVLVDNGQPVEYDQPLIVIE